MRGDNLLHSRRYRYFLVGFRLPTLPVSIHVRESRDNKGLYQPHVPTGPNPKRSALSSDVSAADYFDRQFDSQWLSMDREMKAMERQMMSDFDDIFSRSTRSIDRARERLAIPQREEKELSQQLQGRPGATVERRVESGGGSRSFSYYRSIEIYNGSGSGSFNSGYSTAMVPPTLFSPLLLAVMALAGAWAAVCATFASRYDLTTYSRRWMWTLVPLWPILAIFNEGFRRQLVSVLQGHRARVSQQEEDESPAPGGQGGGSSGM